MKKLTENKFFLILFITVFAVIFSEILVHFQMTFFWKENEHDMGYWLGFWTPLIDGFAVAFLAVYLRGLYEKKLKEQNYKLETIFDTASDGIHILDTKGNILDCNKSFADSLGYTLEEALKLNVKQWDDSIPQDKLIDIVNELIESPKIFETVHKRKDGTTILVQINAKGIELNGKKYLYASQRDITDTKKKDRLLLEQSKMASMGEMIGNIAHQWRQPLSAISSAASGIKVNYEFDIDTPKKDIIENMDGIVRNTQFLSNTIDTFRDFIKGEKVTRSTTIQEEIMQAINIEEAVLKNKHIKLKNNIDYESPIEVTITTGELPQVMINILNNAKDIILEKNIEDSWIELNLKKEDSKAIITIEDNAGGIPEEIMSKIFDPYFTTKHQSQGTGLGLHMSYKIITESFSGNLYVRNTENGAKFFIELPLNYS